MDFKKLETFLLLKKNTFLLFFIILLYLFLFLNHFSTLFFDDLGFDFAGYAQRYHFAFRGWVHELLNGVPASTFDPFLPALLPLFIKSFGFGSFTLPISISLLLVKLLIPLIFGFIALKLGKNKFFGVLLGLIFVLNPITFNFLNRYYELVSWMFFILAFYFIYVFLESKEFNKKYFILSILFTTLSSLSHLSSLFFLLSSSIFLITSLKDLKKVLSIYIFSFLIGAFWFIPFLSYINFSVLINLTGSKLKTFGIISSSVFLIIILFILLFWLNTVKGKTSRLRNFVLGILVLSLAQFFFSEFSLINKPFIHSYHVFYIFAIIFVLLNYFNLSLLTKKNIAVFVILFFVPTIFLWPKISEQYFQLQPRLSNYSIYNEKIDFSEIDLILQRIPKNVRYESFPYDPIISSYSSTKYGLMNLFGWGYNAYHIKNSYKAPEELLDPIKTTCEDLQKYVKFNALKYLIVLNNSAFNKSVECGFKEIHKDGKVLLVEWPEEVSLIENGELLELKENFIKFEANPPLTKMKMSFFPRWNAYIEGKKLEIKNANPGMQMEIYSSSIVELRYEKTLIDLIGVTLSIISLLGLIFYWFFGLPKIERLMQ